VLLFDRVSKLVQLIQAENNVGLDIKCSSLLCDFNQTWGVTILHKL